MGTRGQLRPGHWHGMTMSVLHEGAGLAGSGWVGSGIGGGPRGKGATQRSPRAGRESFRLKGRAVG